MIALMPRAAVQVSAKQVTTAAAAERAFEGIGNAIQRR
jgi:hypothetical protein